MQLNMNLKLKEGDLVFDLITRQVTEITSILKQEGTTIAYTIDVNSTHNDRYPWELIHLDRQLNNM